MDSLSLRDHAQRKISINREYRIIRVAHIGDENQIGTGPIRSLSPEFVHENSPRSLMLGIDAEHECIRPHYSSADFRGEGRETVTL
jgi:hypothetical protein